MRARAKGMAISNMSNWLCNFIIAFITPPLFAVLRGGYYFVLVGSCVISAFVVYFVYPETAHRTLEELGEVFNDGPATELEKPAVLRTVAERAVEGLEGEGGNTRRWLDVPPTDGGRSSTDSSTTLRTSISSNDKAGVEPKLSATSA